MDIREQLYEKLSAEYDAFIGELKAAPPDKIIESAYEKVFKEDILMCFEYNDDLSDEKIDALLALESPLDSLYQNWLDTDVSYMDDLRDTIHSFVRNEVLEQKEKELAPANNGELPKTQVINGGLNVGGLAIVVPENDYGCLIGKVKAIDKVGTPEHDTENPGDDIHMDFTVFNYPPWRQTDFAEHFNELYEYDEYKFFEELSLDDVIIAPDDLISITEIDDKKIDKMVQDYKEAEMFCNKVLQDSGINHEEHIIPPAKKTSIGDKLAAGSEKVKAYKEQQTNSESKNKHKENLSK